MIRRTCDFDLCQTIANMATEAVPSDTRNHHWSYQIGHKMASLYTVTKRHCKRQSLNAIVRQSREVTKDDYCIALNGGCRNLVLSGALPTKGTTFIYCQSACRNECCTTILEAYKPAWPKQKEFEYNHWHALCGSRRLQEMMSHIEAGLQSYARGSWEPKRIRNDMVRMSVVWDAFTIAEKSYMVDCHWRLRYQEQKLHFMPSSEAHFICADSAPIWLPKQQQWWLMCLPCRVVYEDLGKHEF